MFHRDTRQGEGGTFRGPLVLLVPCGLHVCRLLCLGIGRGTTCCAAAGDDTSMSLSIYSHELIDRRNYGLYQRLIDVSPITQSIVPVCVLNATALHGVRFLMCTDRYAMRPRVHDGQPTGIHSQKPLCSLSVHARSTISIHPYSKTKI